MAGAEDGVVTCVLGRSLRFVGIKNCSLEVEMAS